MKDGKIAFSGPFGDINFGDYGMVVNNIFDFDVKNIVLFTYNIEFSNFIKGEYLNDYNIETLEVITDNIKGDGEYAYTPIELLNLTKNVEKIKESLENVEVLVINGGGYFNGLWSMSHRIERLVKIMIPALAASELNIPIVFTGNSYGPFGNHSEFFASFFSSLKNVSFATRDQLYSQMWFNQLGIKQDLDFIPDDLLLINSNINNYENKIKIQSEEYIIIETYLPVEYLKKNLNVFRKFSNYVNKELGYKIVFLPLNIDHGGVDQGVFLKRNLEELEFIDITDIGYLPIQDAASIIKNAKLIISSRYHSLVLALANKTPVISVLKEVMGDNRYYYNKNSGVLRQVFNGQAFDERYFLQEDYITALHFIIENYDEIVNYQSKSFESSIYSENMGKLNQRRQKYINEAMEKSGV